MTLTWIGSLSAGQQFTIDVLNPGTALTLTTLAQVIRLSHL